jgi:putative transposase
MLLTVSVKLLLDPEQKAKLLKTMQVFNAACNFISEWCFDVKVFSKVKIQQAIYHEVRKQFNLPAQFAIRAISRVAETYRLDKTVQHRFKKRSSVEYDARLLNWQRLDRISIHSVEGRLKGVPIVFGEYAKLTEKTIRNSAKLIYRKGKFYLQAVAEVPEEQLKVCKDFFGYDLGIVNIATSDSGVKFSGEQVEKVRKRFTSLRSRLQQTGTKSAKRHLKRISKRERNFKRNTNHIISKRIVSDAKRHGVGIAVEDLHRIQQTVRKGQRDKHGKWAFYELLLFIAYKAQIAGVPFVKVDPRYTSQTCSHCGHREKANRKGEEFKCKSCGMQMHADENAAINIKNRAISALHLLQGLLTLLSWALVNEPIVANAPSAHMQSPPPSAVPVWKTGTLVSGKPTTLVVGN